MINLELRNLFHKATNRVLPLDLLTKPSNSCPHTDNTDENNNRIANHGLPGDGKKVNQSDEHPSKASRQDRRAKSFLISTLNNMSKNFDDQNGSFSAIETTATKRKPNRLESLNNRNHGNPTTQF